jgi:hypothetical protein
MIEGFDVDPRMKAHIQALVKGLRVLRAPVVGAQFVAWWVNLKKTPICTLVLKPLA